MYVDPEALKVNGLTQEQISKFPFEQEKMHSFLSTLTMLYGKLIPVGHNYTFDLGFLDQVMDNKYNCYFDRRYMDTMIIARFQDYCFRALSCNEHLNLGYESFSLQGLCKELNIDTEALGGAHTSEGDIKATRLLFYKLCGEFRSWVLDPRDRNTNDDSEKKD